MVYDVVGNVELDGWTGTFTVSLTQNRIRILGRCFALMETASGAPGLTLTRVTPPAVTPPPPPAASAADHAGAGSSRGLPLRTGSGPHLGARPQQRFAR